MDEKTDHGENSNGVGLEVTLRMAGRSPEIRGVDGTRSRWTDSRTPMGRTQLLSAGKVRHQGRRTVTTAKRRDHRAFSVITVGCWDTPAEGVREGKIGI